jgi:threonine/homoserine/homoserine lactone efflux protein
VRGVFTSNKKELVRLFGIYFMTDFVARKIKRVGGVVDKITGAVLIALGLKILLESQPTGTANLD